MARFSVTRAFDDLSRLVQARHDQDQTDGALLERFVHDRDETAFSVLVRRHGPTVLGLCRRVLRHEQDAEDAFQAAFLVLARKAGSLHRRESAGAWLFQVAYRLALKMKTKTLRRQTVPVPLDTIAARATRSGTADLHAALDAELSRLPEKYRAAVLLCKAEGLTRAEAAQQLGWKPGAVKIRLERALALLRDRMARRGLASSAVALLLDENIATAALPAGLAETASSASTTFAQGTLPASAAHAAALAQGALRTMTMIKLKIAGVAGALLLLIGVGAGQLSHEVLASRPGAPEDDVTPTASAVEVPARSVFVPPAEPAPKPLRVLLFAGGPTREYQFVRRLFVNKVAKNAAELSVCVQDGGRAGLDVPAERILNGFPEFKDKADDAAAEKEYANLLTYDVVIAFDPDWTALTMEQVAGLARWVKEHRGGLVLVAGQINTYQLARGGSRQLLKPLLDLLPVVVEDSRTAGLGIERVPAPRRIQFADAAKKVAFLNLDGQRDDSLAAWEQFFTGGLPEQADPKRYLIRGFDNHYPIKSVKQGAVVLATVTDRGDPPFLVTGKADKGRTVFLAWGDVWRLRLFNESYYEHFWDGLAHYAADAPPSGIKTRGQGPPLSPEERQAVAAGLGYLAKAQHRDGHWDAKDGTYPVAMTALAGRAFLMSGATLTGGKHAERIRRAVDYLIERSQRNGLIGGLKDTERTRYMVGHGHALFFLASVYGEEEDGDRRRKLRDVLTRAVEFTGKAQATKGGWGNGSAAGDNFAEPSVTLAQLQGLAAARAAGIGVPQELFDKGHLYLVKSVRPGDPGPEALADPKRLAQLIADLESNDFPARQKATEELESLGVLAIAALEKALAGKPALETRTRIERLLEKAEPMHLAEVLRPLLASATAALALTPAQSDTALAEVLLAGGQSALPPPEKWGQGLGVLESYFFPALLAYRLGENGHARLLPKAPAEKLITWKGYRESTFNALLKAQNADGSWDDMLGNVRGTALRLAILQMENAALPVLQR